MWKSKALWPEDAIAIVLLMSLATSTYAAIMPITLEALGATSDVIVLVKVTAIESGPTDVHTENDRFQPVQVATARVIETWKGSPVRQVRYVASPVQTCDVSSAEMGERVLLFLMVRNGDPEFKIAHFGRGGMRVRDRKGKTYATIRSNDVRLPDGTATIPGPEPRYRFIRSVELSTLRKLVRDNRR